MLNRNVAAVYCENRVGKKQDRGWRLGHRLDVCSSNPNRDKRFYVHGSVHLSNTSFIKYQRDATFSVYLVFITLHVSDAVCVHHQE